jgi:hypothetical protein
MQERVDTVRWQELITTTVFVDRTYGKISGQKGF